MDIIDTKRPLAFQDEMHANAQHTTGYDYMMMNLVRMESPGLAVLAIHRLLRNIKAEQIDRVVAELPERSDVQEFDTVSHLMQKLDTLRGNRLQSGCIQRTIPAVY